MLIANKIHKDREEVLSFCSRFNKIYLYGAGIVAEFMLRYLFEEGIKIEGIIVSDGHRDKRELENIKIYELSEVCFDDYSGVILGVGVSAQSEIMSKLCAFGLTENQLYSQRIYWTNNVPTIMLDSTFDKKLGTNRNDNGFFAAYRDLNTIGIKYDTDKSDTYHNYLSKYEFFLERWRNKSFSLLELGVFNGGSLETWRDYFPHAQIYGVDINEECKRVESERITVIIDDLSVEENVEKLCQLNASIIIDDASHIWSHQIKSLFHLFNALPHGGMFIMEDLETSFDVYRNYHFADSIISTYDICSTLSQIVCSQETIKKEKSNAVIWELKEELEEIGKNIEMISFIHGSCIMIRK